MSLDLLEPVLDGAVRSVAYFNGRLLSAEDLRQDRDATREFLRRLGRSGGEGIAFGLDVSEASAGSSQQVPVLTVGAGVAVNRSGHALALTEPADVRLVRPPAASPPAADGAFEACPPAADPVAGSAGLYVLVIAPAKASEGRVPVSGLSGAVATCNTKYTVEGVQFRLVALPLTVNDLKGANRLRNEIAYRFFGSATSEYASRFRTPFGVVPRLYGLTDELRTRGALTDCEVPLALVRLTGTGVAFIDSWAVRRRLAAPDPGTVVGPAAPDRRVAEGEAMVAQFFDHAKQLFDKSKAPATIAATTHFNYLPPAGLLPIRHIRLDKDRDGTPLFPEHKGFDLRTFFGDRLIDSPDVIDGEELPELLRESALHSPIDLSESSSTKVRAYLIRENLNGVAPNVQRAAVFTHANVRARRPARGGRIEATNNLKQILLALNNYARDHGDRFPAPNWRGPNGEAKYEHSWRVALLPYLEQQTLYAQYNLNEPWDSATNRKVLMQMPAQFAYPGDTYAKEYRYSNVFALVGAGAAWEKDKSIRFTEFTDGTANTILLVTARRSIPWTAPFDINIDIGPKPDVPFNLPDLGELDEHRFLAGFADGSTRFILYAYDPALLRVQVTRNAGDITE